MRNLDSMNEVYIQNFAKFHQRRMEPLELKLVLGIQFRTTSSQKALADKQMVIMMMMILKHHDNLR